MIRVPTHLRTRNPLTVPNCNTVQAPNYLSQWLQDHPDEKPVANYYTNVTPARLYQALMTDLHAQVWDDVLVTSFMKSVIEENPGKFSSAALTEDYVMSGRVIAQRGARVNPNALLAWEPKQQNREIPQEATEGGTQQSRLSAFFCLLLIYRKAKATATDEAYGTNISERLNVYFQGNGLNMSAEDVNEFAHYTGQDKLTENYKKMICAIDAFFFKFSNMDFSKIRMATLPSRYLGAATLTSMAEIASKLGITPTELGYFVFTDPVAQEVDRIIEPGQTAEDQFGYFPYQLEMGLVTKSAYSSPQNPTLYLWLHTMGVILSNERSVKARLPKGVRDQMSTVNSAIATAYAFISGGMFKTQFASSAAVADLLEQRERLKKDLEQLMEGNLRENQRQDEEMSEVSDESEADQEAIERLNNALMDINDQIRNSQTEIEQRAEKVYTYLLENQGISEEHKREMAQRCNIYRTEGAGTIGRFLANLFPMHR